MKRGRKEGKEGQSKEGREAGRKVQRKAERERLEGTRRV